MLRRGIELKTLLMKVGKMTKQLKGLSGDLSGDPFETLAFFAVTVHRINGRVPTREIIIESLHTKGFAGTDEEVQKVVDLLPAELKTELG